MSVGSDPVAAVSQRVEDFLAAREAEVELFGDEAILLHGAAAESVRGGKRLRARFCFAGWRAVREHSSEAVAPTERFPDIKTLSEAPTEDVLAVAAALEVFHAAALVHDDIVDNSDTRRGRPSAHRALEAAHRARGWVGDPARFGRSGALLLGDLLVAWSDDLLEEGLAVATPAHAAAGRREFALMRSEVTIGQFLDVAEESAYVTEADDRHAERALRIASLKSARYSIQQPLVIGAAIAGADAAQQGALVAFGHPVGMAFQLRDDVLGVFGDAEATGKPSGDDLREGKRTVLVAYAREALPTGSRRLFDEMLGDPSLEPDQIAAMQQTIRDTGALERVEDLILDYTRTAERALSGAPLGNRSVSELRELARAATVRTT